MKISIKTLQQQTITIEIAAEKTVLELKSEIFKQLGGDYNVERQKLICSGVILENDRTLHSYNIDETKFVVVMLTRNIIANGNAEESRRTTANNRKTEITSSSQLPSLQLPTPPSEIRNEAVGEAEANAATTATLSSSTPFNVESTFLTGEDYERSVNVMVDMGYSREMVVHAMNASFNNPERAFEYLLTGIPPERAADIEASNQNVGRSNEGGNGGGATAATSGVHSLISDPSIHTMQEALELLRQNPEFLRAALEQVGANNPELIERIRSNPEQFFNMLNSAAADGVGGQVNTRNNTRASSNATQNSAITREAFAQLANSINIDAGHRNQSNSAAIVNGEVDNLTNIAGNSLRTANLSQDDEAAIDRLKAMGFPETLAIEAYLACDRNEQLAVNFLISNDFDD